jgi:CRISPR-associated protein Cse2 (CRISPR_cse2)
MTEASQTQPTNDRPSYAELFRKLSNEMPLRGSRLFNSGISATLRRLDPETEFSTPALVRALVFAGVPSSDIRSPDQAKAWAAVTQALALMAHAGLPRGPGIGKVLAELKLSDNRLARLLTAQGESLRAQALRTVRIVVAAGKPAALDDLLELMLVDGLPGQGEWAEAIRLRIVGSYERAAHQAEKAVAS